jgi:hypothetical protein
MKRLPNLREDKENNMFKYIDFELTNLPKNISEINPYAKNDLDKLRKKYPGMHFKAGKYKDKQVTFILKDLTTKEYGNPIESDDYPGSLFYPPKDKPKDIQAFLDSHSTNPDINDRKIKVTLPNEIRLTLSPATLEPRKVLLSLTKPLSIKQDNPYGDSEYGLLAYSLYQKTQETKNLEIESPEAAKLISLCLKKSYNLPIDMWNYLEVIGVESLYEILVSAMGFNYSELIKKN